MIRWPRLSLVLLPSRLMLVAAAVWGLAELALTRAWGQDRPPTLASDPGALAAQGPAAQASPAGSRSTSSFRSGLVCFEPEPVTIDTAPMRVYTAAIGPGGRVRLVAMRDAGLHPSRFDPVPPHVLWSAEQAVVGQPGLTGVEPVAVAVGASAVVLVSTSGQPGNAVVTAFSKTDGSVLWTTPAIVPSAGLWSFEPAGAAVVVAQGNPGNTITPPVLLVGGTGTITGGARVPVVLGWRLIEQQDPPPVIAGSPLIGTPAAGFRDEVTVARPLLSGQEGRPSAAVLGLGLAGTRLEMPGGTSDWFVRVAHVTNPQSPTLAWRWPAPAIVDFDAYDVPTDLCQTRPLVGDSSVGGGPEPGADQSPRVTVVGTSRGTPNGPREIRLATWRLEGANPAWRGRYFRSLSTPYDNTAVSVSYAEQVDDRPFLFEPSERRGIFVVGSSGLAAEGGAEGPGAETIVLSWSGRLADMQGPLDGKWPRWAAAPPLELQGLGRVRDGGVLVTSPAPGLAGSALTELYSISRWVDTAGSVRWRVMRWRPDRVWPPPPPQP